MHQETKTVMRDYFYFPSYKIKGKFPMLDFLSGKILPIWKKTIIPTIADLKIRIQYQH